ncbi:hypothetical protein V494_02107 [Pseudogymnoascus sp. VKM F-4513 (FW-928)]|nr:hypothetical protein V494_02107 [Pseudogymnoascus sp. VKM F-4513 (FW-928)]
MIPPSQSLNLDAEAISGILGSISIACWVTVFTPQILENFRRGSAESLSVEFIVIWSLGDLCNVFGGILQGVLPTMLILAVYYVLADIVLIWQCLYYRGVASQGDESPTPPSERQPHAEPNGHRPSGPSRRSSAVDPTHLSPATPLAEATKPRRRPTPLQTALLNLFAVVMVAGAGIFGWWVSSGSQRGPQNHDHGHGPAPPVHEKGKLVMDPLGQVFGYGCTVMYLGSRVPQLILNWRRQSTDGLSGMFFLFACLGNVTYFLSILAYEPACVREEAGCEEGEASRVYARYLLVNLSWLIGSIGCLGFDFGILLQFIRYSGANERAMVRDGERRPLLDGTDNTREECR